MEPAAFGQPGVDEGLRPIEAPTRGASIRSTSSSTSEGLNTTVVSSCSPCRATKTRPGSLIQISSTSGSSSNRVNAPNPPMRWCSSSTSSSVRGGSPPER